MSRRSTQTGFTLLETLVAFAITTASLALLYQIHAGSTKTVARAIEYNHVSELAQSLLDEMAATGDSPRESRGTTETGYRWIVRVKPYENSLQQFSVAVAWGPANHERTFVLETLKPLPTPARETTL